MRSKKAFPIYMLILILGICLFLFGIIYGKQLENTILSGLCTGVGIILLSLSLSTLVTKLISTPETGKKMKVEMEDERNARIREKAAWSTHKILIPVMGAGAFALALTNQFTGACLLATILFLDAIFLIVFTNYYSRKL